MADFGINEMQNMQIALRERYKNKWGELSPEVAQSQLLWMIGEIGEVAYIIKKNGAQAANDNEALRKELTEEFSDVLMYFNDVLLCFGVTADELKAAYVNKFQSNMKRW